MAYSIEPKRPCRLPPDRWVRGVPAPLQMLLALSLAAGAVYLAEVFWTGIATPARSLLYTVIHENGHALPEVFSQDGAVLEMFFNMDGSGYVISTGGSDTMLRVGLGLMLPVLVAAFLMVLGLLRFGLAITLGLIFIVLFWQAVFFGREHDMRVFWTICYWALPALIVAFCPWPLLRSTAVLIYALTLTLGVIDALPYLHIEYVDQPLPFTTEIDPASQAAPSSMQSPESEYKIPSDIRQLADYWGAEEITQPRHYIHALMTACALLAAAAIINFILRNRS